MKEYTREELIAICEKAIVSQSKWTDRDSEGAQKNIGRVWQLLKCGCEFQVVTRENHPNEKSCVTDEETIWILFWVHNFSWIENDVDMEDAKHDGFDHDSSGDWLHFYIPTEERLLQTTGGDWY